MSTGAYIIVMIILAIFLGGGIYLAVTASAAKSLSAGRRSFLSGLPGRPGSRGLAESQHALFIGMQIAIQVFGSDDLRARLASLIQAEEDGEEGADTRAKRAFLKSLSSLLIQNQYAWEYGFWDYRGTGDEAIVQFNQWKNELESSMATSPEEMGESVDPLHRYSDQKEFLIVSLLMVIDNRDQPVSDDVGDYEFRPTYAQLARPFREVVEGIGPRDQWRSQTFRSLLDGICELDPRAIERDGVYVLPGAAADGISSLDLLGDEGWRYLTEHSLRLN